MLETKGNSTRTRTGVLLSYVLVSLVSLVCVSGCNRSKGTSARTVVPSPVTRPIVGPTPKLPSPGTLALAGYTPSPKLFVNGPTGVKQVALTFDAGANDTAVPLLLKTLAERHSHCTFFLTGAFCRQYPARCKAIADAGMEIGNHSFHHPKFTTRNDQQIAQEITGAEAEIVRVCGRGAKPLFRYPFGDSDRRVRARVSSLGYQAIHWTLDSLDSFGKPKSADYVADRIISKIKPGSITLMHVSCVESAKSLPRIFDYLDKEGILVVPVSELLLSGQAELAKTKSSNPGVKAAVLRLQK